MKRYIVVVSQEGSKEKEKVLAFSSVRKAEEAVIALRDRGEDVGLEEEEFEKKGASHGQDRTDHCHHQFTR